MEFKSEGSWSTSLKPHPCHLPSSSLLWSSFSSWLLLLFLSTHSQRLLRTGRRERLAPPWTASKSQAGEEAHSGVLKLQLVSFSPLSARIHWTFQGGVEVAKSPMNSPQLLMSNYWMLTMNLTCLSACLSLICLSVCLSHHRLSICTICKCHSAVTFLQTLHWPPTTLVVTVYVYMHTTIKLLATKLLIKQFMCIKCNQKAQLVSLQMFHNSNSAQAFSTWNSVNTQ